MYTGNSRTTNWRQKKKKREREEHAKEMRKLDTFFEQKQTIISPPSPIITQTSPSPIDAVPLPADAVTDLQKRLEEVN